MAGISIQRTIRLTLASALAMAAVTGCEKEAPKVSAPPPLGVNVSPVITESVNITRNYQAQIQAIKTVDIYARVEGYLLKRYFTEGTIVKKGQLLFLVDPAQWQNNVNSSAANLAVQRANLLYANQERDRYTTLYQQNAVSQEVYQQKLSAAHAAQANVASAKAQLGNAELNLSYTRIVSPITGRIGKTEIDVGNLVSAGANKSKLATVVQINPIYVYFNPEASTLSSFTNLVDSDATAHALAQESEGSAPSPAPDDDALGQATRGPLALDRPQSAPYPYRGIIDFVNNTVDSATNTITVRAVIANPGGVLVSGERSRVKVHVANLTNAMLVPQSAIQTDQTVQAVYVLNSDNALEYRVIEPGPSSGTLQVVESGVSAGETVVISNLNLLRNGMKVTPTEVTAPGTGGTGGAAGGAAPQGKGGGGNAPATGTGGSAGSQ